jgi:hypothetical protein
MYPPNGGTPLVATLRRIQEHYANVIPEQGLHCIIATDGEPSEGAKVLYDLVMRRPFSRKWIINFLVCTDQDEEVEYLDHLDKHADHVDVTDDFSTERKQVLRTGKVHKFSYDDYIVKAVVGASSPRIDQMDESNHFCAIL